MSARPVVSTTNWAMTSPATRALSSMDGYGGAGFPSRASTGFSTWNSKYGWSLFTWPVPPTTPRATPPSTPLPVKSASLVTDLLRSTSGILSGMLTGGTGTWNPLGGGGVTTACGGGAFSGSGGGGFFTWTNFTSSCRLSFIPALPTFAVTQTSSAMITTWKTILSTVPPALASFLRFDSMSVVSILSSLGCVEVHEYSRSAALVMEPTPVR